MKFQPKTEQELQAEMVMPAGEYDFEVAEATDTVSKRSGNDMLALKLKVYAPGGGFRLVTDYLLEKLAWKLRHFCEATGLIAKYENGTLMARDCEGRSGRAILQVDAERKSDDGTKTYPPKNSVKDYVPRESGASDKVGAGGDGGMEEDDIPF